MKAIHSKVVVSALIVLIGVSFHTTEAQTNAPSQEYALIPSNVVSLQPGERQCHYFFWSTLGTPDQRVNFNYLTKSGNTDGDDPKVNGYATIIIDESKTIPTAQRTGYDSSENGYWVFRMNQSTYKSEANCLAGIPIKK
jgi:hypothetical protein